ncbi:MAG: hypothetical protein FXF47_08195 [Candidatus Mcinerneyibacterium aminivorans]|uniref:N-acetyltransferase domain-containing protein n=1 Tax=Candidatus Mcinerneyibacterium aminivorans TaxID=2703815 RepID=A0A5D0MGU9_9BACT|nr:MAG: hypothetical protein FXF47_08195 [Candidatus Mcinerneyibacterium aminivorans]
MPQINEISQSNIKYFIKFPFKLYSDCDYWVPPLISEEKKLLDKNKNPFFEHSKMKNFVAKRNGEIVGRISAIINHNHNKTHDEKIVFFGFFDFIDDPEVSKALLQKVRDFGNEHGMNTVRGPMNPSTNDTCGMLIEGFNDDPVVMMPYNYPYYKEHMKSHNYKKAMDLYSYEIVSEDHSIPKKLDRIAKILKKRRDYYFKYISKKNVNELIDDVITVYNKAWESNWGFVPMTEKEIMHMAESLKPILEPPLAFVIYDKENPIGFSLSLPDANQAIKKTNGKLFPFGFIKMMLAWKNIDRVRNITMGVIPEYRQKGVEALLIHKTFENVMEMGINKADLGWILENNKMMNRELVNIGAEIYKKFRIYEKKL